MKLTSKISASVAKTLAAAGLIAVGVSLGGCNKPEPMELPAVFEPNLVHAMKYQIKEGFSMDQASKDTTWIIDTMFGTPDEPTLPESMGADSDYADLLSLDRLKSAAGPIEEGRGLYRQHCASCHGITGNGRGPTAAIISPYPRDYRMGVFKFKSTERGTKPTRDDIAGVIRNGIPGSEMKKIDGMTEDQVQALADYVIYLSIRGELERTLIDDAIFELDLEGGDRIIHRDLGALLTDERREKLKAEEVDDSLLGAFGELLVDDEGKQLEGDDAKEMLLDLFDEFDDSWGYAEEDILLSIADDWLDAEDGLVEVPSPPEGLPVPNTHAEFVKMTAGDQSEKLAESVARGKEIFLGKVAACSKCHGKNGLGDGQKDDFDDWTKDWTLRVGLKPDDRDALIPLLARGALPPKNALPRNFSLGVFRGGDSAEDLYRRITQGIEGSPMPAATFVPEQFEQQDVWHLINFLRSLQEVESSS